MIVLRALQLAAQLRKHLQRLQRGVDPLDRSANVTLADGRGAQAIGLVNQCADLRLQVTAVGHQSLLTLLWRGNGVGSGYGSAHVLPMPAKRKSRMPGGK